MSDNYIPDDVHAFSEQLRDIEDRYNPSLVKIKRIAADPGTIAKLEFTITPKNVVPLSKDVRMYIRNRNGDSEIRAESITGTMDILPGFPKTRPVVKFPYSMTLRHINVFQSGKMCIGTAPITVLREVFDNIVGACIYSTAPSAANYDSPADRDSISWQKSKESSGEFPLIDPKLMFNRGKSLAQPKKFIVAGTPGGLPKIIRH